MVEWIKANKELILGSAGAIGFLIILALLGVLFQGGNDNAKDENEEIKVMEKVEIISQNKNANSGSDGGEGSKQPESNTYFLEPSASELVEKLENLDPVSLDEKTKEFPGLKVMWPLYFFSLTEKKDGSTQLLLDVSEDGFGITVVCDVDVNKYPQIYDVKEGDVLWIAGEITGLVPEGTRQFHIKTEQIRFGGTVEQPPVEPVLNEENQQQE